MLLHRSIGDGRCEFGDRAQPLEERRSAEVFEFTSTGSLGIDAPPNERHDGELAGGLPFSSGLGATRDVRREGRIVSMSCENIDGLGALTLAVPFRVRALYSATHEMALNWTAFWCLFHSESKLSPTTAIGSAKTTCARTAE